MTIDRRGGTPPEGVQVMTGLELREDRRALAVSPRKDADYVFHELTRSICPNCRRVIDAKILLRDDKV